MWQVCKYSGSPAADVTAEAARGKKQRQRCGKNGFFPSPAQNPVAGSAASAAAIARNPRPRRHRRRRRRRRDDRTTPPTAFTARSRKRYVFTAPPGRPAASYSVRASPLPISMGPPVGAPSARSWGGGEAGSLGFGGPLSGRGLLPCSDSWGFCLPPFSIFFFLPRFAAKIGVLFLVRVPDANA
jgi:hypothetical protein